MTIEKDIKTIPGQQVGYALINKELVIKQYNDVLIQWAEDSSKPLKGQRVSDVFPAFIGLEDDLRALLHQQTTPLIIPKINASFDEKTRYFDLRVEKYLYMDETLLLIIMDVTDATHQAQSVQQERNELRLQMLEQKIAELALQEDRDKLAIRLASILDLAYEAIIIFNQDGQIICFNQAAEKIFGYQASEVMNQPVDILLPSRYVKRHQHHVNQFITNSTISTSMGEDREIIGRRKDGTEFPAEASVSKLQQQDEIVLMTIIRDITQRRNAELAQQKERKRLTLMADQSKDGYLIINDEQEITYINPKAQLYLKLPDGEIPSTPFLTLAQKSYNCQPKNSWQSWPNLAIESPRYLVRPETDETYSIWLQVDVLEESLANEILICLRDVTKEVMSYRFSWALHSQISHKLRTPLTYLTMPLKYLKDDYSTISEKERVEFINSAYDGAIRLQSAIEDIFQYLAAVSSEYPSQNICELNRISSIIDNLKTNLQLETVDVLFIDTEDIFIPLPEESLVMVLGELLENAKKFHPQEKPLINVTVSQIANNIQIAVADDGHNLPEEQLTKIWEPYYQVDKYFTGEIVGMGLGLPTVASLIWGVGGSCVAKNRPDKAGLIVELVLPIKS